MGSNQSRTEKLAPVASLVSVHHLWLTAEGPGWLAHCQFKVTVWDMFICSMVLWCAGTIKPEV